ncbi:uncharacterized protein LOC133009717 [Limanda limanda]|nr:uncharacterized protein LOC133009717 [Limanda limanda]
MKDTDLEDSELFDSSSESADDYVPEPHTEETFPHTERDEMLPQPPKRQNPHSSSDEVPSESCRMRPSSIAPPAEESLPPTERNEMQPQPPNKPKPVSTMRPSSKGTTAQKKKTPWKQTEVEAVESHMNRFITSCIVPAKFDCEKCIRAEPEALNDRSWQNVKFYIYNRITANKRKFS